MKHKVMISSLVLLLLVFDVVSSQGIRFSTGVQSCRCKMSVYKRSRCSLVTSDVTAEACEARGCCYDATIRRVFFFSIAPRCFQATGDCAEKKCEIPLLQRQNCGFLHKYACHRAGCCYDYRSTPRCYRATARFFRPANEQSELVSTAAPNSGDRDFVRWSAWGPWGACSQTCTPGSRTRRRQCLRRERPILSQFCGQSLDTETSSCNSHLCQAWGLWAEFGACSKTCGGEGRIYATRRCLTSGNIGNNLCSTVIRKCTTPACPVIPTANWGSWSSWGGCSSRCDRGVTHRTRPCLLNGAPVNGNACSRRGVSSSFARSWQTRPCNHHMCMLWSPFSIPRPCPNHCSDVTAVQVSTRHCLLGGGARTEKERREFEMCSSVTQNCPRVTCKVPTQPTTQRFVPFVTQTTLVPIITSTMATTTRRTTTPVTTTTLARTTTPVTATTLARTTTATSAVTETFAPTEKPTTTAPTTTKLATATTATTTTTAPTTTTATTTTTAPTTTTTAPTTTTVHTTTTLNSRQILTSAAASSIEGKVTSFFGLLTSASTPSTTTRTQSASMPVASPKMTYSWSNWSPCSRSCGPGIQTRFKSCYDGYGNDVSHNVSDCAMDKVRDERRCNSHLCPMWASWGPTFCLEDCEIIDNRLKTATRNLTRDCKIEVNDKGDEKCHKKSLRCSSYCPTPAVTSQWSDWGQWSQCSDECAPGNRTRSRKCSVTSECQGDSEEQESCNVGTCKNWSEWSDAPCSAPCGGQIVSKRRCLDNGTMGTQACHERSESCSDDAACKGDDVMDFLFLVDSTDHVDDCKSLQKKGSKVPVTSEFINNVSTPVNWKMREFIKSFSEGWKTKGSMKTRVAVQMISGVCKSRTGRNLNLMRNFTDLDEQFSSEIDNLPYLCGRFWLDWALRCTTRNVLLPSTGDRPNVPTVVVALLSYVPPFSRPSNFLLSAISQELANKGVPVITASATPPERMSALGRSKHSEMLRTLSCRYASECPLYLGSIWDNSGDSPAQRIRHALSYYAFI